MKKTILFALLTCCVSALFAADVMSVFQAAEARLPELKKAAAEMTLPEQPVVNDSVPSLSDLKTEMPAGVDDSWPWVLLEYRKPAPFAKNTVYYCFMPRGVPLREDKNDTWYFSLKNKNDNSAPFSGEVKFTFSVAENINKHYIRKVLIIIPEVTEDFVNLESPTILINQTAPCLTPFCMPRLQLSFQVTPKGGKFGISKSVYPAQKY